MTQRSLLLLVGLWLLPLYGISAQPGFSMPVFNEVPPNSFVTVPVEVSNFDSIIGVQYVIQWDSQVLELLNVVSYNLPGMNSEDFGLGEAPSGLLRFAWEAPSSSAGHTAPDGTAIFKMKFKVIGEENEGTFLTFTETPPQTIFEVTQATRKIDSVVFYGINDCILYNGYVAVGFTLSTDFLTGQDDFPVSVAPNPFTTNVTATFTLDTRSDVHLVLTNAAGHPLLEQKTTMPPGRHGMEIATDRLPENGIYYLILRTPSRMCVRPLVKL